MAGSCGADTTANELFVTLLGDKAFPLPDTDLTDPQFEIPDGTGDLFKPITALNNEDLTTRKVDGDGTFDAIMSSLSVHLKSEFNANRITGNEYTKAYIGIVGAALQTANSFLLGRDQAYWQAIIAQQQARRAEIEMVTARVQLETAKAQLQAMRYQTLTAEAEYALSKMKLASEDAAYCHALAQTRQVEYTTNNILPTQREGLLEDNKTKVFTNGQLLPLQKTLLSEQVEVQRAQTLDIRTDGQVVTGTTGGQKALWTQQIVSYKRDAEVKAAKMFTDAWITMKTIDEGLLPPSNFSNANLDIVLARICQRNELVV